jgi:hypothetical protein
VLQATGATTQHLYGKEIFKTVTMIHIPAVLSANDGTTVYGAAQITVTLGKPRMVTIIGKVLIGSEYVQATLTNCWFKDLTFGLKGAEEAIIVEQTFTIRDPDSDITLTTHAP